MRSTSDNAEAISTLAMSVPIYLNEREKQALYLPKTTTYWRVERISDRKLLHEANNLKAASAFMEWYLRIKNIKDQSNHRMVEVTEKELWVGMPQTSKIK